MFWENLRWIKLEIKLSILFIFGALKLFPYSKTLNAAKEFKIVKTSGSWSKFGETTFQGTDGFKEILEDEQIKQQIYDQICDEMIMKYEGASFNIDENVLEED